MHTTLPNSSVLEARLSKFRLDGCVGFGRFAGCRVCSLVAWYHALELRHDSKHSSSHIWQDSCRQLYVPLMNFTQIIVSCAGLMENFSGASCGNSSCGPLGFRVRCRSPSFPNTTSETTCQSTHGGIAWIIRETDNRLHCFGDFCLCEPTYSCREHQLMQVHTDATIWATHFAMCSAPCPSQSDETCFHVHATCTLRNVVALLALSSSHESVPTRSFSVVIPW